MTVPTHAELTDALQAPAFIHEDEIGVLCKYAALVKPYGNLVEIGCAWGGSTALFLLNMPQGAQLTSVDPFVVDPTNGWQASREACRNAVLHAMTEYGQEAKLIDWFLWPMTSSRALTEWTHGYVQLLYIDGDHSERGVNLDFGLWITRMERGSVLLLHDSRREDGYPDDVFARGWPAPTALANRLRTDAGWKLVDETFSLTVWEKQ